jgi:hypothetical protein
MLGLQEGLRVGDTAVCIGCASPLVLVELPYEFRLMTKNEVRELDYGTRELLERAQATSGKTLLGWRQIRNLRSHEDDS